MLGGHQAVLKITSFSRTDAGTYTAVAINRYGESQVIN